MYFFHWCMTGIVDITAIAAYVHFWGAFEIIPQWVIALIALALVVSVNMVSVKWFGDFEFWAALVKVVAFGIALPAMVGGWFVARRKVIEAAAEREGYTGRFPPLADRPSQNSQGPVRVLDDPDEDNDNADNK